MMDRQEVARAGLIRHPHRLLRRAVGTDPRLVSANRHDRQLVRAMAAECFETVAHGGIASKDNLFALATQDVAVVAAISITPPACSPVFDFKGPHVDRPIGGADGFL